MSTLKLEELAGYLPWGLKGIADGRESIDLLLGIYGTGGHSLTLCYRVNNHNTVDYGCDIEDFKPLLFPLSSLTKPITINGETFVPIERFYEVYGGGVPVLGVNLWKELFVENIKNSPIETISFGVVQKLLEWKFDVFQLIPHSLAIEVTEDNNIYK